MKTASKNTAEAFTRTDALALSTALLVLSLLGASALATSKSTSDAIVCLGNHRTLIQAWSDFTADNDGKFPGAFHGGYAADPAGNAAQYDIYRPWCAGWMTWGLDEDNTNFTYFTNLRYGSLTKYVGGRKEIIKCPSDRYLSKPQKSVKWTGRMRSYSGSLAVGDGNAESGPWDSRYLHAKKISDLANPAPGNVFVFLEEHPDSINDAGFFGPRVTAEMALTAVDIPAAYHEGACVLSFADGHAGLRRWNGSWREMRITYVDGNILARPASQDDLRYLFDRTPKPVASNQ